MSGHEDDLTSSRHPTDAPVTRAEYDAFVSHFQRELRVSIMSVQEEMQKVMQDTLRETLDRASTERVPNRDGLDDRHVGDRLQPFPHRDRNFGDDGRPRGHRDREDPDGMAKIKLSIPSFSGKADPEVYLEWESRCDQIFRIHGFSDEKRVNLASLEFIDYALTWWNQLQEDRLYAGNGYIRTWDAMKRAMRHRFVPPHFQRDLYNRLQRLVQGTRTVDEYYKEMEVLMIRTNMRESAEANMSRFLSGLNREIANHVEMFPYNTLQELVHQATKVEQQQRRGGRNHSSSHTWRRPHGASGGGTTSKPTGTTSAVPVGRPSTTPVSSSSSRPNDRRSILWQHL